VSTDNSACGKLRVGRIIGEKGEGIGGREATVFEIEKYAHLEVEEHTVPSAPGFSLAYYYYWHGWQRRTRVD
jgi:hypothetical protein